MMFCAWGGSPEKEMAALKEWFETHEQALSDARVLQMQAQWNEDRMQELVFIVMERNRKAEALAKVMMEE